VRLAAAVVLESGAWHDHMRTRRHPETQRSAQSTVGDSMSGKTASFKTLYSKDSRLPTPSSVVLLNPEPYTLLQNALVLHS